MPVEEAWVNNDRIWRSLYYFPSWLLHRKYEHLEAHGRSLILVLYDNMSDDRHIAIWTVSQLLLDSAGVYGLSFHITFLMSSRCFAY